MSSFALVSPNTVKGVVGGYPEIDTLFVHSEFRNRPSDTYWDFGLFVSYRWVSLCAI